MGFWGLRFSYLTYLEVGYETWLPSPQCRSALSAASAGMGRRNMSCLKPSSAKGDITKGVVRQYFAISALFKAHEGGKYVISPDGAL